MTHYSGYKFVVIPFGLTNAPATFMCLMNIILRNYLDNFVVVFIEDILIYSKNEQEHEEHLKIVLQVLREQQLYTKFSKCDLFKDKIHYLGHVVSKDGISVNPDKVKAMMKWLVPKNVYDMRSFMGITGYYRKFIEGFSNISYPVTSLKNKARKFEWTKKCEEIFNKVKHLLTTAPILKIVDPFNDFAVSIDACNEGLGRVLLQDN